MFSGYKKRLAFVCGIGFLVFYFSGVFASNPQKEIDETLDKLSSLLSIVHSEERMEAVLKAGEIGEFFFDSIEVQLEFEEEYVSQIKNKKELIQKVVVYRELLDKLEMAITNRDFEIDKKGKRAKVLVDASALGSMPKEEGQFLEMHRIRLGLEKVGDRWKIYSAQHLDNLRE